MEARLIFSPPPFKLHSTSPRQKNLLRSKSGGGGNDEARESDPPTIPNIRYRLGSRRQQAKQEKRMKQKKEEVEAKKKWEDMRVSEKALEIYLGEKGVLFWLNKLAYASIFLVIGGWILFRFVGPYFGLYQLDSTPLSPTSIFKNG